ncbi:hypothetical protein HDU91_004243 [Kappamyces sp. JEL0680]|nr:hypothetical protein HDU91_004243 [Kappamyces sp. JEL0680]
MEPEAGSRKKGEKPPKPGSKQAQKLKKMQMKSAEFVFEAPGVYVEDGVLILLFLKAASLSCALQRPHLEYEGRALKGPLKGVNMPLEHLQQWQQNHPPQDTGEEFMVQTIGRLQESHSVRYVIACLKGDASSLLHEWAHAKYWREAAYVAQVRDLYDTLDQKVRLAIERELHMRQYRADVFLDEFQAYCLESPSDFGKRWREALLPIHIQLRAAVPMPQLLAPLPTAIPGTSDGACRPDETAKEPHTQQTA